MREIKDKQVLRRYLDQYHIPDLFDTKSLPFRLYEYAPGEMMNLLRPTAQSLKFLVSGSANLYSVRSNGSLFLLQRIEPLTLLGDMEFCGAPDSNRYQEVLEAVYTVELPLQELKPVLLGDNRFLRFLLESMAYKISAPLPSRENCVTLEEGLLFYIRYDCQEQTITSVEDTIMRLGCSRRQIQRVLKKLTESGAIKKISKGCYRYIGNQC